MGLPRSLGNATAEEEEEEKVRQAGSYRSDPKAQSMLLSSRACMHRRSNTHLGCRLGDNINVNNVCKLCTIRRSICIITLHHRAAEAVEKRWGEQLGRFRLESQVKYTA